VLLVPLLLRGDKMYVKKCSAAAVQGQRDSRSSTIAALNAAAITAYSKHIKQ